MDKMALNPRGKNGRFVVDEGRVVKPSSLQRRQARLVAEQRKREQLLKFIQVFVRRGNDCDFIPATRDGPMDTMLNLIFPPAWRMNRPARESILRRFVYGAGAGAGPRKSKELPRPRVTDPVTNFSDRVFVYRKVRFPNPNLEIEMNPVRGYLQTLKTENILPYVSVQDALNACDDILKSYKKIPSGGFGYCGFPKTNRPTRSRASANLSVVQPFALVVAEAATRAGAVASVLAPSAGATPGQIESPPAEPPHPVPSDQSPIGLAEPESRSALSVVSGSVFAVPPLPNSTEFVPPSQSPPIAQAPVAETGTPERTATPVVAVDALPATTCPAEPNFSGKQATPIASVVRTVTPGRLGRRSPAVPVTTSGVALRDHQKRRGSNGRFEAMDIIKPASIQRRKYRETMDFKRREQIQKFVEVIIRRGGDSDFIPALRDGPLDQVLNIVFAPAWRSNLHTREKVVRRWVHGGSGGPQRTKDLPRRKITDPDTSYSERVHVYRRVRFPNAASMFEMEPVEKFLEDLKVLHMLAAESVQETLLACEDVFKTYKQISVGVFGYSGFPKRSLSLALSNEAEVIDQSTIALDSHAQAAETVAPPVTNVSEPVIDIAHQS